MACGRLGHLPPGAPDASAAAAAQVSSLFLERVRTLKARMVRLKTKVETVRRPAQPHNFICNLVNHAGHPALLALRQTRSPHTCVWGFLFCGPPCWALALSRGPLACTPFPSRPALSRTPAAARAVWRRAPGPLSDHPEPSAASCSPRPCLGSTRGARSMRRQHTIARSMRRQHESACSMPSAPRARADQGGAAEVPGRRRRPVRHQPHGQVRALPACAAAAALGSAARML